LIPGARAVLARGWRRALRSSDAPGPRRLAWPLSRSASGSAPGARPTAPRGVQRAVQRW